MVATPKPPYLDSVEDAAGAGAYVIGDGANFGQGLTEQAVDSIVKPPKINAENPLETLGQYLNRIPLEVLKTFALLFGDDVVDNFDTASGAIDSILNSLIPNLQDSWSKLAMTFFKFLKGTATWDDVAEVWGVLNDTLTELNIEAGEFWGQLVAISISPWVTPEFTDALAELILVYFKRTQNKATQQELEDALDALLATESGSDFWKGLLGSTRFVWRVGDLLDTFFKFVAGQKTQAELTASFNAVLELVGLSSPMPVKDFTQNLAMKWIADLFAPSSLSGVTDDLQTTINQIGDIFDDLVVTPINQAVQNVKDWWNSLWSPTKQSTAKNEDAFAWLTDMFKQKPASKPPNPGSIPTGDPLSQALENAWDWFSGLMGWQDTTTSDVGSASATANAAQTNALTALDNADDAYTKASNVETAFNDYKGVVFGRAVSQGTSGNYQLSTNAGLYDLPSGLMSNATFDSGGGVTHNDGELTFAEPGWYHFIVSFRLRWSTTAYVITSCLLAGAGYGVAVEGHAYANPAGTTFFAPVVQCNGLVNVPSAGYKYRMGYRISATQAGSSIFFDEEAGPGQLFISAVKIK